MIVITDRAYVEMVATWLASGRVNAAAARTSRKDFIRWCRARGKKAWTKEAWREALTLLGH
jgi:hypothetical protein